MTPKPRIALPRWIIGHGWASEVDIIEAPSLEDARSEAARRSMLAGLLDDDLSDTTWAIPYDADKAWEMGLLVIDEDNPRTGRLALASGGEDVVFER
mgnify:CR=1 FL=1